MFWRGELYNFFRSNEGGNNDLFFVKPTAFRESMNKALTLFIEMRHASRFNNKVKEHFAGFLRNNPPSGKITVQYLAVTVYTTHHGLSLSASPNYFKTWRKFGSPTSPVVGSLLPGSYIFGGVGVSVPRFKYDPIPADIPPNYTVTVDL